MRHIKLKLILAVVFVALIGAVVMTISLDGISVAAFSDERQKPAESAYVSLAPIESAEPEKPSLPQYELITGYYSVDAALERNISEIEKGAGIITHSMKRFSETGIGVVFELENGELRALQFSVSGMRAVALSKLFKPDSDYVGLLHDLALAALVEGGFEFDKAAALLSYNEDDYANYVLDGGGLIIYLNAEDAGEVCISVEALGDIWLGFVFFERVRAVEGALEEDDELLPVMATKSTIPDYSLIEPQFTKREDGKKYIAISFDDGPNPICTPLLLDILAENDAKATFFMLGQRASLMPEIVKRVAAEGHEIGNHSYNHLELTRLSEDNLRAQIVKTNDEIYDITGELVHLLRPPYGSRNSAVVNSAIENDMAIIIWDIDPQDWRKNGADAVADHVISRAKDGSIILLHDIYRDTVDAAEKIIIELKNRGYEFITVSDLIHMNCGLEYGSIYRDSKGTVAK